MDKKYQKNYSLIFCNFQSVEYLPEPMYKKYTTKQQLPPTETRRLGHRRIMTQIEQCSTKKSKPLTYNRQLAEKQYSKPKTSEQYSKVFSNTQSKKNYKPSTKSKLMFVRNIPTEPNVEVEEGERNLKYQVDGIAGKGTFGVVYYGHMRGTGEKIAIKKVLQDKKYKNRELDILKMIKHPNVLDMKDYFYTYENGSEFLNIIMSYFSQNLYQVIKRNQLTPLLIKLYSYQIFKGLHYLSTLSIAHRDIKPQNILVDRISNTVVICDFGSAKKLVKTENNIAYICSRCYRAPELIFGATDYTPQIDMWSAGCVLVQMVNGEAPFLGDSQIDQLLQIMKVLGTPMKNQVEEMNRKYDLKQYKKFPSVKSVPWNKLIKLEDPLLVDLVRKILQYSPEKRYTALEAIQHPYYDELREQETLKKLKKVPEFLKFSEEEIKSVKLEKQEEVSERLSVPVRIQKPRRASERYQAKEKKQFRNL